MLNADRYIEKYKQLEAVVRSTYGLKDSDSISYYLENQAKFKKFREEIKYCQDVRNLLQHKKKLNDSFAVEPTDVMFNFIDNLIEKIKNRHKCKDIQIKRSDIFWQPIEGNVKDTMKIMQKNLYTHVPILENNVVIGVFDENSIFTYLATEEIIEVSETITFKDIEEYISLDNREMESFIFFTPNAYVDELQNKIECEFKKGKRVGMAFITASGKCSESLQGIITPWDIIAFSE